MFLILRNSIVSFSILIAGIFVLVYNNAHVLLITSTSLVFVGSLLNLIVTVANNGCMPAATDEEGIVVFKGTKYIRIDSSTKLPWLADRFHITSKKNKTTTFFSIGDVVVFVGLIPFSIAVFQYFFP